VSGPVPNKPPSRDVAGDAHATASAGRLVRGSSWAFTSTLVPQAFAIVTSIVIARELGADGVGRVALIAFVSSTLITLLILGLPPALIRYVGEELGAGRPARVRGLMSSVWRLLALPAFLGFAAMAAVGALGGKPAGAWVLAGVACGGAVLHSVPACFLIGAQRWRDAHIVGISTSVAGSVAKVAALLAGGGITSLFAVDAVAVTVNVLGTTYLARRVARNLLPRAEPPGELTRNVIRFAAIGSIGLVISLVVFRRTEVLFLQHYSTDTQIALYSVPFSIVVVLLTVPRSLNMVVAPTVASLVGAGEADRVRPGFGRALRLTLAFAIAATALGVAVGPEFITLLYGPEFAGAGPVLVVLLVTLPFVPLMTLSQSVLLGLGRQWVPTGILAITAVVNIALDFALIPSFDAIGAAVANSTAQVLGAGALVVYASVCVGGVSFHLPAVVRSAVAAAVAGAAAFGVVAVLPPIAGIPLATVVFLIVALPTAIVVRALAEDDAAWIAASLGPRVGRPVRRAVDVITRTPVAGTRDR
jgi:O-antigen/teichoic acid export membrane protein